MLEHYQKHATSLIYIIIYAIIYLILIERIFCSQEVRSNH